jgi:hypothetical protein
VDAEVFGALAPTALELGLTKQQYAKLSERYAEIGNAALEREMAERQTKISQLKGEWGNSYDERVGRVGQVVKALGGHPVLEAALAEGVADANTLRLFDTIATQLGKENTQMAQQLGGVSHQTPAELRQRRDEMIQRQIKEDLTPQQREDLQKKVIAISEELSSLGG